MNNVATLEKLKTMKLFGMERTFRTVLDSSQDRGLSCDELIAMLADAEYDDRHHRRTQRLVKSAGFRNRASFPTIDFSLDRGLDRTEFLRLADCSWIKAAKTIIIAGPTGIGKSFLAQALGSQACAEGYRTLYFNCAKLFQAFKDRRVSNGYQRYVARIAHTPLLILDDFGIAPLDSQDRLALLEISEDRLGRNATIISTQIPVAQWFDVIGDPTIADAVCDRIVPQALRINLLGKSVRAIHGIQHDYQSGLRTVPAASSQNPAIVACANPAT